MKKIQIIIALVLLSQQISAQRKEKAFSFRSINSTSVLIGENSSCFGIQTVNGVRLRNSWFIGLGAGYDAYQASSIPVFVEVRKYITHNQWQPFIYANVGENFTLHNSNYPRKWNNGSDACTFTQAWYTEAGIGINKSITKTTSFFITAGYSLKQFNYTYQYPYMFPSPNINTPSNYRFDFRRWIIKMGLEL